jgi:hypothetical protein
MVCESPPHDSTPNAVPRLGGRERPDLDGERAGPGVVEPDLVGPRRQVDEREDGAAGGSPGQRRATRIRRRGAGTGDGQAVDARPACGGPGLTPTSNAAAWSVMTCPRRWPARRSTRTRWSSTQMSTGSAAYTRHDAVRRPDGLGVEPVSRVMVSGTSGSADSLGHMRGPPASDQGPRLVLVRTAGGRLFQCVMTHASLCVMTHATPGTENRHDTLTPMTGRSGRGTARQTVRVDEALWKRFGDARERAGAKDRSAVIREFIRWYVRDRDEQGRPVPMPKRPDAEA